MAHGIVELTDANFESEVLKSDQPVLVDFWAPWCGPCRQLTPIVEDLARDYAGKVKVAKLNTDDHDRAPQRYDIMSLPTLLVFKGGQVAGKIIGAVPRSKIETELKRHL